jgi:hypothetical protein
VLYPTVKNTLTGLKHLRGTKTKGATLQHPFGLTRALCFDEDTPEGLQRLKEAAQLLAIPGFQPIVQPSPVPAGDDHAGGGHLWIIFTRLVDAYSARMTVYQYTGSLLQQGKEYWPRPENNRVRLPGGKYVKPGFEAWCHLYDENGVELSSDGAGAARVLLERQTPSEIVGDYAKPAPALVLEPQRIERPQQAGGYLEKDVSGQVIAEFNAAHSWEALLGKSNSSKKYLASWRGDKTPNVAINPKTDLAKDFARPDEPAMDSMTCGVE